MFKWLRNMSKKSTSTERVLAEFFDLAGNASWLNRDYLSLSREGYAKNVIAYRCIKGISDACADIPFFVRVNGNDVENHPIVQLLTRPNPQMTYKTFMRTGITHRLISGNTYMLGNKVSAGSTNRIMELSLLRPDRVQIEVDAQGRLRDYKYTINNTTKIYPIDSVTLISEVLHTKEVNPIDDLYGLSPIAVSAMGIDQHNEAGEWNMKLLENSARPPGVLVMKDKSDSAAQLTLEQKADLRAEVYEKLSGYANAGKLPILTWDMDWKALGMSPADMEWINSKSTSARDICLAFGYPSHLLGMPEGATFNNVGEAKLSFYEETVIPLIQGIHEELSYWLSAHIGQTIEIVADLDQVSALAIRRETTRKTAREDYNAGLITVNEARLESGYDEIEGGDERKLPFNFDLSNLDKQQFAGWLVKEGFSEKEVRELASVAYG